MREAMKEGRKANDLCGDNPPVGCVMVLGDQIVSRGHTNKPGDFHAEAMALNCLKVRDENIIAFVTLEPCSFHGRTPSCAKSLIDSGIKKVYVGIIDPDPRNNGKGILMLQVAGIKVDVGLLESEIKMELGPYLRSHT